MKGVNNQCQTYNQSVIARRAGMTPDKLCAALKHRRRLDANEFLAVCAALDMTPEDVAGYGGTVEGRPTHET